MLRELRLFVIRLNPNVTLYQVDDLHARRHQLPILHMALPHRARIRRNDAGVSQVHGGDHDGCFFGLNIGPVEIIFGIQRRPLSRFAVSTVAWLPVSAAWARARSACRLASMLA